ncbi:hypothetical protein Leryth_013715, partial [Lithospermum erythrorhizon]
MKKTTIEAKLLSRGVELRAKLPQASSGLPESDMALLVHTKFSSHSFMIYGILSIHSRLSKYCQ